MSDMHSSRSAASVSSAAIQHYSVEPFSLLPPTITDAIFQRLNRLNLAECSLVCKAWRHLPLAYLHSMSVSNYNVAPPAAVLPLCWHLRKIHVSSSSTDQWPPLASVLASQPLPSLRLLELQHSSHTSREQLLQLQQILQVQGPQCCLHLALTDKTSLQALLPLLPFPGLVQLDLNVPYLPEGAAALLAQAAAMQATGPSETAPHQDQQHAPMHTAVTPTSGDADLQQHTQQQQQQRQTSFSVGVWVCCWGGCRGINLPDVVQIKQQLQATGCGMHGIESVNCSSNDDIIALGQAVQDMPGLRALGFNYKTLSSTTSTPLHVADPTRPVGATANAICSSDSSTVHSEQVTSEYGLTTAALAALLPLAGRLQKLTMHGCPEGGFGQGSRTDSGSSLAPAAGTTWRSHHSSSAVGHACHAAGLPAARQMGSSGAARSSFSLHPLACLTSLTKLSLLKQWSELPMPIGPIAHLTGLVELALERQQFAHRAELSCLGRLTRLKVLSLVLTVTAEQLESELEEAMPLLQQRLQATSQGYLERAGYQHGLSETAPKQLESSMQAMQLGQQQTHDDRYHCNCCCGRALDAPSIKATPVTPISKPVVEVVTASQPQTISRMLQGIAACPCSQVASPGLLDWEWMRQLHCLETAWMQVPHLDLACLPSSLTELDAQQPHDLTAVSITCDSGGTQSTQLPNLRRAVLPRTMSVTRVPASPVHPLGLRTAADLHVAIAQGTGRGADACSEDWADGDSSTDEVAYNEQEELQLHYNACLLLELCAACPELRELEVVQWELPVHVVLYASKQLRHLRLLSMLQPESTADVEIIQQQLSNATGHQVTAKLQERLVLSSYPWSSVLAIR